MELDFKCHPSFSTLKESEPTLCVLNIIFHGNVLLHFLSQEMYLFFYLLQVSLVISAERTRNNDNDVWGIIPGKAVFPSVLYCSKCDASFTDVYEWRNTACKRIKRLSFEHKKQGNTLKIYWQDDNLEPYNLPWNFSFIKTMKQCVREAERVAALKHFSSVCVAEGAGEALLWWDNALLHMFHPQPVSRPAAVPNPWQSQGNAPHRPNPAREWPPHRKSHLGEEPRKAWDA